MWCVRLRCEAEGFRRCREGEMRGVKSMLMMKVVVADLGSVEDSEEGGEDGSGGGYAVWCCGWKWWNEGDVVGKVKGWRWWVWRWRLQIWMIVGGCVVLGWWIRRWG